MKEGAMNKDRWLVRIAAATVLLFATLSLWAAVDSGAGNPPTAQQMACRLAGQCGQ